MVSVPRTRLLRASPIGRVRPSRSIWTSKSAIARGFRRPLEVNVLGQLCAGQRLTDSVVTDVGDLAQTFQQAERLKDARIDRKSVVEGTGWAIRVDLGGRRVIKK